MIYGHDIQQDKPFTYCTRCGGEIYTEEEYDDGDGVCAYCKKIEETESSDDEERNSA